MMVFLDSAGGGSCPCGYVWYEGEFGNNSGGGVGCELKASADSKEAKSVN